MRILMIGGSPYSTFMSVGVSLLSALAKRSGHDFQYFDLCGYSFDTKDEHSHGEAQLEYKKVWNPERAPKLLKKCKDDLVSDFLKILDNFQPHLIGLSATSGDACFGKHLLEKVKAQVDIPVIVGGVYPTVDQEDVIAEPWVDMINIGQGEESFIELLNSFEESGEFDISIRNVWFKKGGGIVRNPMRPPFEDFDGLPYPDWSIYDEYHFYRPFLGNMYRYGTVEIARGCPMSCKYCINSYIPEIYGKKQVYCCKSVERSIAELKYLKETHDIEFFRFCDELFLAKPLEWLREFGALYKDLVKLPFIISTTASSVTREKVQILKEANCVNMGLGVETGNERLRMEMLNKKIPDTHFSKAYKLLNDAGIRTTAQIMFGLPYETTDDYLRAIRLVKKWNVDTAHVAIFYPFKGCVLREEAIESGLLSKEKIEAFERDRFITTRNIPAMLEFDEDQLRKMDHYRRFFTVYKEVPEWLWPMVDECMEDSEFTKRLSHRLREVVYEKRFA